MTLRLRAVILSAATLLAPAEVCTQTEAGSAESACSGEQSDTVGLLQAKLTIAQEEDADGLAHSDQMPAPVQGYECPNVVPAVPSSSGTCPCQPIPCNATWTCVNAHYQAFGPTTQAACKAVMLKKATLQQERCCYTALTPCKRYQTDCFKNISTDLFPNIVGRPLTFGPIGFTPHSVPFSQPPAPPPIVISPSFPTVSPGAPIGAPSAEPGTTIPPSSPATPPATNTKTGTRKRGGKGGKGGKRRTGQFLQQLARRASGSNVLESLDETVSGKRCR